LLRLRRSRRAGVAPRNRFFRDYQQGRAHRAATNAVAARGHPPVRRLPPEMVMMKPESAPPVRRRYFASAVILAGLVATGCMDRAPTAPAAPLQLGAAQTDRALPTFTFTSIDATTIPGALAISPQGINASGDISGSYVDAGGRQHGFILHDGAVTTIDFPGADGTNVSGIGPSGDVVGTHWLNGEEPSAFHGFRRSASGEFQEVHYTTHLYEIPQRILPDGTILGCRHDHDLGMSMFGISIGPRDTSEVDMPSSMTNGATPDRHLMVGLAMNMMTGVNQAFRIDNGMFAPIIIPGAIVSTAWDVNPRGDIVGFYRNTAGFHGYVLADGGVTTIDAPDSVKATATRAFGINARGDVVGTYVAGGKTLGFVERRQ
jgi:hypothetical protein